MQVDVEDEAEDDLDAIMQDLPRSKVEILNSGLQLAGALFADPIGVAGRAQGSKCVWQGEGGGARVLAAPAFCIASQ
jgi:hypothetical protein